MELYKVSGGVSLVGEVAMHGAKNSVLPILAAALLTDRCVIHNCPRLSDVEAACAILNHLGCRTKFEGSTIIVDAQSITGYDVPENLMREMRSSIVFLGAILARTQKARISFPGGCELGPRPIDLHLSGLSKLGVNIIEDHGYLDCNVEQGFNGANISLSFPSVGATENIMIASCIANGTTIISNAAREPEIEDLAGFLTACGAKISGAGSGVITIEGVPKLHGCEYSIIPDRIATATYLSAAAVTRGSITVRGACHGHLSAVLPVFEEAGCNVKTYNDAISLSINSRPQAPKYIRTMPYPGFPTDAQAPVMVMTSLAKGTAIFCENIFENRYKHVDELARMGAKIKVEGRVAVVEGVNELHSASVDCTDLRGGAGMVLAALAARGISEVREIRHIERGYEDFEQNLKNLGAKIEKHIV